MKTIESRIAVVAQTDHGRRFYEWVENGLGTMHRISHHRLQISIVKSELAVARPDAVLVFPDLINSETIREHVGFVRKVRKHLPNTAIIVWGSRILDWPVVDREALFAAG